MLSLWLQVVVDQGVARTEEEEGHYQTPKLSRLHHLDYYPHCQILTVPG